MNFRDLALNMLRLKEQCLICANPANSEKVMSQLKTFKLHLSDFKILHAGLMTLDMRTYTDKWTGCD